MDARLSPPADPAAFWPGSLWRITAPGVAPRAPLADHATADVCIIGAGFTGLNAALTLAVAGTRVIVLDADDVGWGATGRNGGQVNPMLPFNAPARIRALVGASVFERLAEVSLGSADALFETIRSYRIACEARQHGWLRVNHSAAAHRRSVTTIRDWNAFGAGMQMVEGADLRTLSGSPAYASGVVAPRGGAVQPLMLAQGLAAAAEVRGAVIHGQSAVTALTRTGGKWQVRTARGSVGAATVIVATNGYTTDLIPGLSDTVIPVTPIQIATEPLDPDRAASILPGGHTISDSRRVIMYARREPDNRIVYGGHGRPDRHGNLHGWDWLRRDAERVFPHLAGARWTHRWGGRIAITDDHLPHLHEPAPGLLAGLGYNGRGVAMANVMGRVLAERALGAEETTLPFPITNVRPIPMRRLKTLGLPVAIRMMRLMDYLETR